MKNAEEMVHSQSDAVPLMPNPARKAADPADRAGSFAAPRLVVSGAEEPPRAPIAVSEGIYLSGLGTRPPQVFEADSEVAVAAMPASSTPSLHDRIVQSVVELKRTGLDAVTVVIRPDAQTEFTVLVQMRHGQVEVDAQCHRGDCAAWTAPWSQLQQTFAQQGIRLGALQDFTPWSADTSDQSGRHQSAADESQFQEGYEPSRRENLKPAPLRAASPVLALATADAERRWESWA